MQTPLLAWGYYLFQFVLPKGAIAQTLLILVLIDLINSAVVSSTLYYLLTPITLTPNRSRFRLTRRDKSLAVSNIKDILIAKHHHTNNRNIVQELTIDKQLQRKSAISQNLLYALEKSEFSLHYQPRLEIATQSLVGLEALLRWYNPQLGWVSPTEFIPIAEEMGLISSIGKWVLHSACRQTVQWQEIQHAPLKISVNISTLQFEQPALIETITYILEDTGLEADSLELEITESILIEDMPQAIAILQELKAIGISIALDDFGTGYSSLNYLQQLPIDTLKIDRSLITDLAIDSRNIAIFEAIIALAQALSLKTVAEGVETQAQLESLQSQGCQEIQGYYFSKPLPSDRFLDFLVTHQNQETTFVS